MTYQLPAEGLSIQTPPRWHLVEDPLPALAHPHALIELSNYYAPLDPNSGCVPSNAIASLPDQDFVLWLEEWGSSGSYGDAYPPRQDPFQLGKLAGVECITRPAHVTPFSDQGRYFELFVVFGPNASDSLRQSVIDSLDTLQVDPTGGTDPGPDAAPSWYAPPTFTPAPGWQTISTSPDGSSLAHDAVPETWASNVPFAQADLASLSGNWLTGEFWPQHTIDGLSGDGVVMIAELDAIGYSAPIDGDVPVRTLPLDVHDESGPVEGGGQYVLWGVVNHQNIAVRFFYGPDPPTSAQLRAAQDELNNLIVPSLPPSG
ncbi:MAG: hypothetical protein ACM3O7_10750 [Acidobacteriota bacterium]